LLRGFERFRYTASAAPESIDVSGGPGSALGVVTITLTQKTEGEPATRSLRYLIYFERHAARDWRILLDMDNRDLRTG
jgi:ketosteroid isomerase-like protein